MNEATTVGCNQCGGTITVADLTSEVHCPFCRSRQQLDPRWLQAAMQYAHTVEGQNKDLERAKEEAAVAANAWDWETKMAAIAGAMVGIPMIIIVVVTITGGPRESLEDTPSDERATVTATSETDEHVEPGGETETATQSRGDASSEVATENTVDADGVGRPEPDAGSSSRLMHDKIVPALWLFGMFMLVAIPFGVASAVGKLRERGTRQRHRRVARPEVLSLAKQVACPSCGSSATITVGAAVHSCPHCGASLAATAEQMARGAWALAIAARRRLAGIRPPSPWWRDEKYFDASVRHQLQHPTRGGQMQPWALAPHLAAALRGNDDISHRARWFYGYWPEAVTSGMFRGSFVWGYCRGYPVALDLVQGSRRQIVLKLYVAAIASPAPSGWRSWNLEVHRSLSGFHARGTLEPRLATVEAVAYVIDQLCLQALRGAFPPAPYVEPMVEATPPPQRALLQAATTEEPK
jgi:predicted RNA-binding Zn-ribbon protein involved in translation (DUF1610 family)